ncbi:MAG: glycosyltransferase family 2 protein [Verrucomicrobia bacterium]|nr:glycosyltransferase family 2 protein [Verrucomicrobiota bacterium]
MACEISIVVPVLNEADNVLPLAREVAAVMSKTSRQWELVLVDDGSTDATWQRIAEAHGADAHVRGLRLERNSGQSAALWTGLQATASPVLATLDGDLQNDPADLPRLLTELDTADFVIGVRVNRRDTFVRRASSSVARLARRGVLAVNLHDTGCSLRVFRREVLSGLFAFNGLHRFLPMLVQGGGARCKEVPVNHRPRIAGVSKYGVWNRAWRGLVDLFAIAWFQRRRLMPVKFTELPPRDGR